MALTEVLNEKEEEMLHMENLITALTWKERIANDELQDACEEAISVCFSALVFGSLTCYRLQMVHQSVQYGLKLYSG